MNDSMNKYINESKNQRINQCSGLSMLSSLQDCMLHFGHISRATIQIEHQFFHLDFLFVVAQLSHQSTQVPTKEKILISNSYTQINK